MKFLNMHNCNRQLLQF